MSYVSYLPDEVFESLVKEVLDIGRSKKDSALKDFHKNVIDPFSALFEAAVSEIDHEGWVKSEIVRQNQKTLSNHIGNLHQKVLGAVTGWQDLGVGSVVDLVCEDRKIVAEIKNKFNTVTGGKLAEQYYTLERLVAPKASQYKGYTAYFVNIIPKNPQRFDKHFEPSDKEKGMRCPKNDLIRIIDGASFYTLVTGRENALAEFHQALPNVIEAVFHKYYGEAAFKIKDKAKFKHYFSAAFSTAD